VQPAQDQHSARSFQGEVAKAECHGEASAAFSEACTASLRIMSRIVATFVHFHRAALRSAPSSSRRQRDMSLRISLTLISARRMLRCRRNGLSRCFAVMSQIESLLPTLCGSSAGSKNQEFRYTRDLQENLEISAVLTLSRADASAKGRQFRCPPPTNAIEPSGVVCQVQFLRSFPFAPVRYRTVLSIIRVSVGSRRPSVCSRACVAKDAANQVFRSTISQSI
jgi:hypothetical protein